MRLLVGVSVVGTTLPLSTTVNVPTLDGRLTVRLPPLPCGAPALAVMAPSVWWDDCILYKLVDGIKRKPPLKIWLDTGTAEPGWQRAGVLRDRLVAKGWVEGQDLVYKDYEGAGHHESAWAGRMGEVLKYLFPPKGR